MPPSATAERHASNERKLNMLFEAYTADRALAKAFHDLRAARVLRLRRLHRLCLAGGARRWRARRPCPRTHTRQWSMDFGTDCISAVAGAAVCDGVADFCTGFEASLETGETGSPTCAAP